VHRILLDTNIFISAIGWRGNPRKILEICIEGVATLVTSLTLYKELSRVLSEPEFEFIPVYEKEELMRVIIEVSDVVEPNFRVRVVRDDDADNRVIECALAGNVDFIVTGDKHLLKIRNIGDVKIVTCYEMLRILKTMAGTAISNEFSSE